MSDIILINKITDKLYLDIFPLLKKGEPRLVDSAEIGEIVDDIQNGRKQLWVVFKEKEIIAIIITAIIEYKIGKRLLYYLISGTDLESCMNHHDEICSWAKSKGCNSVEIFGRKGWLKKLKQKGYRLDYIAMSADI